MVWTFRADSDSASHTRQNVETATAEIAEAVQDWLSGYEFVLWPISSRSPLLLFKPDVRDGNAVWIDRVDDSVSYPISELCTQRGQHQ